MNNKLNARKNLSVLLLIILAVYTALPAASGVRTAAEDENETELKNTMRGVWVASVGNLDFPSKPGLSPEKMKKELNKIVANAKKVNLNSIFFQVRPSADSLYRSAIFPRSKYLTGRQGKKPKGDFDPLEYIIKCAAKSDIGVHAWINPYRITTGTTTSPEHKIKKLAKKHPARKYPGTVIKYRDGKMYFDPGNPKTHNIIIAGVKELVTGYDLAGIHFDDYFYPGGDFPDSKSYAKYGGSMKKGDWRRSNVDKLITDACKTVHDNSDGMVFGVSPAGIWANRSSNKLGSDTNGNQTYYVNYADTRKWCRTNMIDYIAPQIYWEIGYKIADYEVLTKWWADVVKDTGTDLYIGQPLYRLSKKAPSKIWRKSKPIRQQLALNNKYDEISGSIFFGYSKIKNNIFSVNGIIKKWSRERINK